MTDLVMPWIWRSTRRLHKVSKPNKWVLNFFITTLIQCKAKRKALRSLFFSRLC